MGVLTVEGPYRLRCDAALTWDPVQPKIPLDFPDDHECRDG
jgi:hypothetical protein